MMKKNLEDDDGVISQKDVSPAQLFEVRENTTQ